MLKLSVLCTGRGTSPSYTHNLGPPRQPICPTLLSVSPSKILAQIKPCYWMYVYFLHALSTWHVVALHSAQWNIGCTCTWVMVSIHSVLSSFDSKARKNSVLPSLSRRALGRRMLSLGAGSTTMLWELGITEWIHETMDHHQLLHTLVTSIEWAGILFPTSSGDVQQRIWCCLITHQSLFHSGKPPTIRCIEKYRKQFGVNNAMKNLTTSPAAQCM